MSMNLSTNCGLALGVSIRADYALIWSQAAGELKTLRLCCVRERLVGCHDPVGRSDLLLNQSARRVPNLVNGLFPSYFPL